MTIDFLTAPDRACLDADTDLFVPEPRDTLSIAAAKAICAQCRYIVECRTWADGVGDVHAVLGGTTGPERAATAGHTRTARAMAVAARRENVDHLAASGLDNAAIAARLGVSRDVVYTDRTRERPAT